MIVIVFYCFGIIAGIYTLVKKRIPQKASLLLVGGSALAVIMHIISLVAMDTNIISEIARMDKGGRDVVLNMEVEAYDSKEDYDKKKSIKKEMDLTVSPIEYSAEELMEMEAEFWKELYPLIKGENRDMDHVNKPLNLPASMEGYPFQVTYSSSLMRVLNNDGTIGDEASADGDLVEIKAGIALEGQDFLAEEVFYANVFPALDEASFFKRLSKAISQKENSSRSGKIYTLPAKFEGKYISYSKKTSDNSSLIFLMGMIAAGAIVMAEKKNEEKLIKLRMDKMEEEYPQMVSKMSMFVGAGMTISGAFRKMAKDHGDSGDRDKPLYDEMLKTAREVESGISERKAWRDMGNRCRMPCVVRFCALIAQYSQSGAQGLKAALAQETDQALKERRERARRLGEEAGTKLLFPMVLMLMVVMVVIMVPAFTSFGV